MKKLSKKQKNIIEKWVDKNWKIIDDCRLLPDKSDILFDPCIDLCIRLKEIDGLKQQIYDYINDYHGENYMVAGIERTAGRLSKTPTLLQKIVDVIDYGDTRTQITGSLIKKYPKVLINKTNAYGDGEKAIKQINAEVSSELSSNRHEIFNVDRSRRPYRYNVRGYPKQYK